MRLMAYVLIVFLLVGCFEKKSEAPLSESKSENTLTVSGEWKGYDLKGEQRSCKEIPKDVMCTMQMTESDTFAQKCKEAGHQAFQCGCHDWLCSENIGFESH